jgi:hypothetical protein
MRAGDLVDDRRPRCSMDHWLLYRSPLGRVSEFALGVLVAALYTARRETPVAVRERSLAAIAAGIGVVWAVALLLLGEIPATKNQVILLQISWGFAPSVAAVMFYLARCKNPLSWFVENKTIILLGDASYSIYLLQWVFFRDGGRWRCRKRAPRSKNHAGLDDDCNPIAWLLSLRVSGPIVYPPGHGPRPVTAGSSSEKPQGCAPSSDRCKFWLNFSPTLNGSQCRYHSLSALPSESESVPAPRSTHPSARCAAAPPPLPARWPACASRKWGHPLIALQGRA